MAGSPSVLAMVPSIAHVAWQSSCPRELQLQLRVYPALRSTSESTSRAVQRVIVSVLLIRGACRNRTLRGGPSQQRAVLGDASSDVFVLRYECCLTREPRNSRVYLRLSATGVSQTNTWGSYELYSTCQTPANRSGPHAAVLADRPTATQQ